MFELRGMFISIFFGLCVYYSSFLIVYRGETRDKESEPAQVHLYAGSIMALASAGLTMVLSMVAMMSLGVHNGYWLVAVMLTLTAGFMLVKHIFEKVLPETMGETRPVSAFIYSFGAAAATLGLLMIFWGISIATGIAVQYDCLPFKV